jgi:carboxymethylenebutenolidase
MGGPLVFRTSAFVPDRVRGAATFHGGGLAVTSATATDVQKANSPHLLVPQMKLKNILCAVAQTDDKQDPTVKETVRAAFASANIPAEIEVYPADHGWCPPDNQTFNQEQADRAWGRLLATFSSAL